jgi:hypothetical protein
MLPIQQKTFLLIKHYAQSVFCRIFIPETVTEDGWIHSWHLILMNPFLFFSYRNFLFFFSAKKTIGDQTSINQHPESHSIFSSFFYHLSTTNLLSVVSCLGSLAISSLVHTQQAPKLRLIGSSLSPSARRRLTKAETGAKPLTAAWSLASATCSSTAALAESALGLLPDPSSLRLLPTPRSLPFFLQAFFFYFFLFSPLPSLRDESSRGNNESLFLVVPLLYFLASSSTACDLLLIIE